MISFRQVIGGVLAILSWGWFIWILAFAPQHNALVAAMFGIVGIMLLLPPGALSGEAGSSNDDDGADGLRMAAATMIWADGDVDGAIRPRMVMAWQCPNCGEIGVLDLAPEGEDVDEIVQCGGCGSRFSTRPHEDDRVEAAERGEPGRLDAEAAGP